MRRSAAGEIDPQSTAMTVARPTLIVRRLREQLRNPPLLGAMGTLDAAGAARVRMVVIRGIHPGRSEIVICADSRSRKVRQLKLKKRGELCIWLPVERIQLRLLLDWTVLEGGGTVRNGRQKDRLVRKLWTALSDESQLLFARPPSGKLFRPGCGTLNQPISGREASASVNFSVLTGKIIAMDALVIGSTEHIRYLHQRRNRKWHSVRINP